jgi:multicomponent Na+:H+ antiporter subunit B
VTSVVLRTVANFLVVLLTVLSVFLLLRGHNEPGGGFIGGLMATAAFMIYALGHGVDKTRRLLRVDPITLVGAGLSLLLLSTCVSLLLGEPFLTAQWVKQPLPGIGKVSTVLAFDVGVYLAVLGTVTRIILSVAEE